MIISVICNKTLYMPTPHDLLVNNCWQDEFISPNVISLALGFMCTLELNALTYSKFTILFPFLQVFSQVQDSLLAANLPFRNMASPSLLHSLLYQEVHTNYEKLSTTDKDMRHVKFVKCRIEGHGYINRQIQKRSDI